MSRSTKKNPIEVKVTPEDAFTYLTDAEEKDDILVSKIMAYLAKAQLEEIEGDQIDKEIENIRSMHLFSLAQTKLDEQQNLSIDTSVSNNTPGPHTTESVYLNNKDQERKVKEDNKLYDDQATPKAPGLFNGSESTPGSSTEQAPSGRRFNFNKSRK